MVQRMQVKWRRFEIASGVFSERRIFIFYDIFLGVGAGSCAQSFLGTVVVYWKTADSRVRVFLTTFWQLRRFYTGKVTNLK